MIVFEVRSDGTVVSTPSLVAQGISLSDLVVLADADYSLVTMHFTPPSGIYIPDVVFTPTHTQGRNLWQAVMPPEISRISGAVTYQIFLTSADGKTLPTPTGRITVQEGVISNMPETAEELGQYSISALYQLMANFYASLEGYRQTLDELAVKTHKWTILASDWTDSTPYQASIVFPHGNYAKPGTLILVAPADNRSREQIEKGRLTVTVHDNGVIDGAPVVDTAVIVRGGKAPTEDINLVLFFIDTQGKDEPMTQWIGIDMGSILPEVTEADNDKIPMVINGKWALVYLDNVTPPTTDPVPTPSGYTPIKILSFSNGIIGAREYGDSIQEVTLAWSLSKSAKTIKIDGTQLDASATSHKISGLNITKDSSKTWQLEVTDERDYKATKTTAPFTFANGVYYGAAAEPAQYDSAFVLGLEKVLQNGKVTSISVNAAENLYIYYALPARYGECSFTVGTFTGGFELVETIEFTNAHGYTEAYNVYRSDYPGLGQTTVKVS